MALPAAPTSRDLEEYLQNDSNTSLHFRPGWYAGMSGWAPEARDAVVDAARQNASIRYLTIDIAQLGEEVARTVSRIIRWLGRVRRVSIVNTAGTCAPRVVDALLGAIVKMKARGNSPVEDLCLHACSSPDAFVDCCTRLPGLEGLGVGKMCTCGGTPCCDRYRSFLQAVARSARRISSLNRFQIKCDEMSAAAASLVHSLSHCATVKTLDLRVTNAANELLWEAASLCGHTATVDVVVVKGIGNEPLDVSPLFDGGPPTDYSFSTSIREFRFLDCDLGHVNVESAATALQNLEMIGFGRCRFPAVFDLLVKLPSLKELFCLSRSEFFLKHHSLVDEFNEGTTMMETNEDLERLCRFIEREESLIRYVEIDLVGREDTSPGIQPSYPALERLLSECKGRLTVNVGDVSRLNCEYIVSGLDDLCGGLKRLSLRFHCCSFVDVDYARIIGALQLNTSLTAFELGFDTEANLGTPEASVAAIGDLLESNDNLQSLSIQGLDPEATVRVLEVIIPALHNTNRSLRTLELDDADLTVGWPAIRGALLAMLQVNRVFSKLVGVVIPRDNTPEGSQVGFLLWQNRYGRRFLQERPALVATTLARASNDNQFRVMYAFLRADNASIVGRPRRGPGRGAPVREVE
jgi:hypothetical protein